MTYRVGDRVLDSITGKTATVVETEIVHKGSFSAGTESYQALLLDHSITTSPNFPDRWRHDKEITLVQ